jgi:hypothetical protein
MKIRNGFVSNSSSSSFCLYGVCVSDDQIVSFANQLNLSINGFDSNYNFISEWVHNHDADLDFHYESPFYIIGREYQYIGDDETGKEFTKSVSDIFKDTTFKCQTYTDRFFEQ